MSFKSESQRRFFYAANRRGEISDKDLKEWEDATPKDKKLPERLHKKEAFLKGFRKALSNNPEIPWGIAGAGFGAGIAGLTVTEESLRANPKWMADVRKEAKKQGITPDKKSKKWKAFVSEQAKKTKRIAMGANAVSLGALGAAHGYGERVYRDQQRAWENAYKTYSKNYAGRAASMGLDDALAKINVTRSATTKAEVKKSFREVARKNHPDLGGSEAKMKEINEAWDTVQKSSWFDKLAFLRKIYEETLRG